VARTDGRVELSVSDNGRGMDAETLERVFEPFFTDKRGSRAPGTAGTGLGLSITHAIVEAHGGRIRAHSDGAGKGSRFTVELPAAGATAATAATAANGAIGADGATGATGASAPAGAGAEVIGGGGAT